MKRLAVVIIAVILIANVKISAFAVPYYSYTYEKQTDRALGAPAGAVPDRVVSGDLLQVGSLVDPSDAFSDSQGNVYILDSGNGRVLCIDSGLEKLKFIIQGAKPGTEGGISFQGAQGIFVNSRYIYVADTENARILRYNIPTGKGLLSGLIPTIIEPKNLMFDTAATPFRPMKIVVDNMERMFIVAGGIFEGLVELSKDGVFLAYIGANKVKINIIDQFWRIIATRKQWEAMSKFIPVEFSNLFLDKENFMYATARGTAGNAGIRRLNLSGINVLRSDDRTVLGDIDGYSQNVDRTKETYFIDAVAGPYETFAGLDLTMGRVFVYDSRCNLLYQFGGLGSQIGTFVSPSALIWLPDNRMGVLDRRTGELTIFRNTEYGSLMLSAVEYEFMGEYEKSAEIYRQVLTMNSNCEMPYIGVGKQLLRLGEYKEAMQYFKLGNDREYYSKAYEQYRKGVMAIVIPGVIIAILALVVLLGAFGIYKKVRWLQESIDKIQKTYHH